MYAMHNQQKKRRHPLTYGSTNSHPLLFQGADHTDSGDQLHLRVVRTTFHQHLAELLLKGTDFFHLRSNGGKLTLGRLGELSPFAAYGVVVPTNKLGAPKWGRGAILGNSWQGETYVEGEQARLLRAAEEI